jgi:hypothetical protein
MFCVCAPISLWLLAPVLEAFVRVGFYKSDNFLSSCSMAREQTWDAENFKHDVFECFAAL